MTIMNIEELSSLSRAHRTFSGWLHDHALPFWSTQGTDPNGYGFVEHLTLEGEAAELPYKRMRVQARQVYVFSHAALLGFEGGAEAARRSFRFMTEHGRVTGGGWARRLGPTGGIVDETADLYDLAFVLFACAWHARAFGSDEAITIGRETFRWIQQNMRHPLGGFYNCLPQEGGPRCQNPHMHLLEAVLTLYETSKEPEFAEAADGLVELFENRFFHADTGTLGEFFDEDLTIAEGITGNHVEPGHHYEWVWLLDQVQRLTGRKVSTEAAQLYDFANRYGVDRSGIVIDLLSRDGTVLGAGSRLWPQTEAIKAHLAMDRNLLEVERIVANLTTRFFADTVKGTWRDQFDAQGLATADRIPSSSLYHIFMAFGELDRVVKTLGPGS